MDMDKVFAEVSADITSVTDWCNRQYDEKFAKYFKESRELFRKLEDTTKPISDDALNWILISLPINLFDVSEALNQFRLSYEVVKLRNAVDAEAISAEARKSAMLERKVLSSAFSSVITRVENEISFSRELIMGAKKIWDGRRATENVMPVSESAVDKLPKYVKGA